MIAFVEAFKKSLVANGIITPYSEPYKLISRYETLVAELSEIGYDDFLIVYDSDLSVRDTIDVLINDKSLLQCHEMRMFIERVNAADMLLKASFLEEKERPNNQNWWNRGILKKGSGDYANDIKLEYGIVL